MRLIVITNIEKKFALPQLLSRRLHTQEILKTNYFGKGLGGLANIKIKKPTKLSLTYSRVQIRTYI